MAREIDESRALLIPHLNQAAKKQSAEERDSELEEMLQLSEEAEEGEVLPEKGMNTLMRLKVHSGVALKALKVIAGEGEAVDLWSLTPVANEMTDAIEMALGLANAAPQPLQTHSQPAIPAAIEEPREEMQEPRKPKKNIWVYSKT